MKTNAGEKCFISVRAVFYPFDSFFLNIDTLHKSRYKSPLISKSSIR